MKYIYENLWKLFHPLIYLKWNALTLQYSYEYIVTFVIFFYMYVILGVERECVWCIMRALKNGLLTACVRRAVVSKALFHSRFHRTTSR
jgi:hypothetical protein